MFTVKINSYKDNSVTNNKSNELWKPLHTQYTNSIREANTSIMKTTNQRQ